MLRRVLALALLGSGGVFAAPSGCVGSAPVTSFRLTVQPPGNSTALRLRLVNNLPQGSRVAYRPMDLPADMKKDAKLTLVLVPQDSDGSVTVLEPKLAAAAGDWVTPFAARIALLVFAPQGLDEKRLTNLVTKDEALVQTLADYADETADLESQFENARELEREAEEDDRPAQPSTPAEQALFSLVRALNPAVSGYDPLGTGRIAGPTTMMGKGEAAFFESAGGIVPGGGVLPMMKIWLLPDTEFRSVYAIPAGQDGMTLCTKLQTRQNRKIAYLWAYRMAGGGAPKVALAKDIDAPLGMRVTVPVKLEKTSDWRPVSRVFDWTLAPVDASQKEDASQKPVSVSVRTVPDARAFVVDLRKFPGAAGTYRLEGKWDWSTVKISEPLRLHPLNNFQTASLTPETQDKFIAATGTVPIELTGADFLFVDHAWLHRTTSARQIPADLPPVRSGPSNQLRIEVDTDGLRPGPYLLALARVDGAVTDLPVRLLPAPPRIETTAARVNLGDREEHAMLAGSGLDRIQSVSSAEADLSLEASNEDGTRRGMTVRLHADAKPGDKLELMAKVDGMSGPLRFPGVLQVAAARPHVADAKASIPADLAVAVREGEIPAGSWVNFVLHTDPAGGGLLTLQCAEPALSVQALKLHVGEKQSSAQLVTTGGGLFLSLDPGAVGQSGCTLTAAIETGELGKSDPFTLGRVVRLPHIESFAMTDDKSPDGFYGVLKGTDLDTIAKTGWDNAAGLAAPELPRPAAGEAFEQTLRIAMPWPSPTPKAPLYVWLRGETEGRATKVNP